MSLTLRLRGPSRQHFARFRAGAMHRLRIGIAKATARAAANARDEMRSAMRGAVLGRLGGALATGSDQRKGSVQNTSGGGFRASGWIAVRGGERARGAIRSYSQGATIVPGHGKWLAFPTANIPSKVGRRRITPRSYAAAGLDQRIGPLVFIPGETAGRAYLIVENVTVGDTSKSRGKARRPPKTGRTTRAKRGFVVAFILIRKTRRAARFDPKRIATANLARVPDLIAEEMARGRPR